jgi:hypothetical protein
MSANGSQSSWSFDEFMPLKGVRHEIQVRGDHIAVDNDRIAGERGKRAVRLVFSVPPLPLTTTSS